MDNNKVQDSTLRQGGSSVGNTRAVLRGQLNHAILSGLERQKLKFPQVQQQDSALFTQIVNVLQQQGISLNSPQFLSRIPIVESSDAQQQQQQQNSDSDVEMQPGHRRQDLDGTQLLLALQQGAQQWQNEQQVLQQQQNVQDVQLNVESRNASVVGDVAGDLSEQIATSVSQDMYEQQVMPSTRPGQSQGAIDSTVELPKAQQSVGTNVGVMTQSLGGQGQTVVRVSPRNSPIANYETNMSETVSMQVQDVEFSLLDDGLPQQLPQVVQQEMQVQQQHSQVQQQVSQVVSQVGQQDVAQDSWYPDWRYMLQPLHTIRRVHRQIASEFQQQMIRQYGSIEAAILSQEMRDLSVSGQQQLQQQQPATQQDYQVVETVQQALDFSQQQQFAEQVGGVGVQQQQQDVDAAVQVVAQPIGRIEDLEPASKGEPYVGSLQVGDSRYTTGYTASQVDQYVQNALDKARYHSLDDRRVQLFLRFSELVVREMIGNEGPCVFSTFFFHTVTSFQDVEQGFIEIVQGRDSDDGGSSSVLQSGNIVQQLGNLVGMASSGNLGGVADVSMVQQAQTGVPVGDIGVASNVGDIGGGNLDVGASTSGVQHQQLVVDEQERSLLLREREMRLKQQEIELERQQLQIERERFELEQRQQQSSDDKSQCSYWQDGSQQQVGAQQVFVDSGIAVGESGGTDRPSLVPATLKLEKPQPFYGKHSEVKNFIFSMKQYLDSVNLGTGETACRFVVSFLRDQAATWWRSYAESQTSVWDFLTTDELFDELEQQFSDLDRERKLMGKILQIKQYTSVQGYVNMFRMLQIELGKSKLDDDYALHVFIAGLKPQTKQQVLISDPKTLEEAMRIAEKVDRYIEEVRLQRNVGRGGNNNNRTGNHFGGNRGGHRGSFGGQGRGNFGNRNNFGNRGGFGNRGNGGSGARGRGFIPYSQVSQYSNSGYSGPAPMVTNALQRGGSNSGRRNVSCHYCGKMGHYKRDCFKMQREQGGQKQFGGGNNAGKHVNFAGIDMPQQPAQQQSSFGGQQASGGVHQQQANMIQVTPGSTYRFSDGTVIQGIKQSTAQKQQNGGKN